MTVVAVGMTLVGALLWRGTISELRIAKNVEAIFYSRVHDGEREEMFLPDEWPAEHFQALGKSPEDIYSYMKSRKERLAIEANQAAYQVMTLFSVPVFLITWLLGNWIAYGSIRAPKQPLSPEGNGQA